ncbi:hypothetical protein RQP46_008773 [Phenoliferia psychrophenolica]
MKHLASGAELRVVYSSVDGAELGTGIPHFESKWKIEKMLRKAVGRSRLTVLRPVVFMDNLPKTTGAALFPLWGHFDVAIGGKKVHWVSTKDIGRIGALALTDATSYAGRTIGIASEELSISDIQDRYAIVNGIRPTKVTLPCDEALAALPPPLRATLEWLHDGGSYTVDIGSVKNQYPGMMAFEDYLKS